MNGGACDGAMAYRGDERPDESEYVAVPLGVAAAVSAKARQAAVRVDGLWLDGSGARSRAGFPALPGCPDGVGSVMTSPPRGKLPSASVSGRGPSPRTAAREIGPSVAGPAAGSGPRWRISGDEPATRRPDREPLPDAHSLYEESLEPRPGPR